jgi:integrase
LLGKSDAEFEEKLLDGQALLFTRNGVFQVRLYKGNRQYIYKSLKTRKLDEARQLAVKAHYELEFRKDNKLPLQVKRFGDVIDEYVRLREGQHQRGTYKQKNKSNQQQTSAFMLRQIKRVSKFWREYGASKDVAEASNAWLREYVDWRRDYYVRMPESQRPRNHKLTPADKTLEWETTFALTLLKFADEQGYRGEKKLPTYRFKAGTFTVRPAFTLPEYTRLYKEMRRWMNEEKLPKRRYTRELLRDYVLLLANSGIRVGEANSLRETDVQAFTDERGRRNYSLHVTGKTGSRMVVIRTNAVRYIERTLERNAKWKEAWANAAEAGTKQHNRKQAEQGGWLFRMADGNKIVSLGDQFKVVLKRANLQTNTDSEPFSLYSLRHFYAVQMLRGGKVNVFDVARNMGTSVQIIERYYGKFATPMVLATRLGG